jgi:hypothetical protein
VSTHGSGATGVRVVDGRVHRRTGPWTADVHDLLAHVRSSGLPEAPEVLGFDDNGDEVLAFIEGDEIRAALTDGQLASVGDVLRRLRAALAAFPDPGRRSWRRRGFGGEELAHGDVGWWNLVFRGDEVVGLIDWDLASTACQLFDLAYALWTCVPLEADLDVDDALRRARIVVDAFGATDDERRRLPETIAFAQARVTWVIAEGAVDGDLGLPRIWDEGRRLGRMGRSMTWLAEHRDALAEALTL